MSCRIRTLFHTFGSGDYIGDPVSILEHILETATLTTEVRSDNEEYMAAALLHDIGHMFGSESGDDPLSGMDGYGVPYHESLGRDFLASLGFPARVYELVGLHVDAKRFLTVRQTIYYVKVSEDSHTTL